jgi:DNA-binding transcriptional ArsR family regulator
MSPRIPSSRTPSPRTRANLFAALGDETRLKLLVRLSDGEQQSIAQLTDTTKLTRQAVTKHLRVLERVRIVRCTRAGRESLFAFNPEPLDDLKQYLDLVSERWDNALARLKSFVEDAE